MHLFSLHLRIRECHLSTLKNPIVIIIINWAFWKGVFRKEERGFIPCCYYSPQTTQNQSSVWLCCSLLIVKDIVTLVM